MFSFNSPSYIVVDVVKNLVYVSDTGNHVIRVINVTSRNTTTFAGTNTVSGSTGDGNLAINAKLNMPQGLAIDYVNNLVYIAESNCVRVVNRNTGIITRFAGVCANRGTNGDGGSATSANLNLPYDVAVDSINNLVYIAEYGGNVVRVVNRATNVIQTFAGNNNGGYNRDGVPALSTSLNKPTSIRLSPDKTFLFVADSSNRRVRAINRFTGNISTIAGNGNGPPYTYDENLQAKLYSVNTATALDVDPVNNLLYVTAANEDCRVLVVNLTSNTIRTFSGSNAESNVCNYQGEGNLAYLQGVGNAMGVAVDFVNNVVYQTSTNQNRVFVTPLYNPVVNKFITLVAGTGATGSTGDEGPAVAAQVYSPIGLTLDYSTKRLYFADSDNSAIRYVNITNGVLKRYAGQYGSAGYNTDGFGTDVKFNYPRGTAIDVKQNLMYVSDAGNQKIRVIDLKTQTTSTLVNTGYNSGYSGDGGPAALAKVNNPYKILVDYTYNLLLFSEVDNRVIRAVNRNTGIIWTFAGNSTRGNGGDGGFAVNATFGSIRGIALDPINNLLYVADGENHRIRVINKTSGVISHFAGSTNGASGYIGDGSLFSNARFNEPDGLRFDYVNNLLYVADASNHCIRVIDMSTGMINNFAGFCTRGGSYSTGYKPAQYVKFNYPRDVELDLNGGMMYISDGGNR
ncbi:NHL repeat-containing protein, partial [Acrasis kona]